MQTTQRLIRKRPGSYVSADGRFTVVQFRDCTYGRGASVPRGWNVTDATTGKRTHLPTLGHVREFLATVR